MGETFKLFQQYTFLRNQLAKRDESLKKAIARTIDQEQVIGELRQFVEQHRHAMYIIDDHLKRNGVPRYSNIRMTSGKPSVDRMISGMTEEHFDLYSSIVFATDDVSPLTQLTEENKHLKAELQCVKDQLDTFDNAGEVFERDSKKKEMKIAELKAENAQLKQ